jgi:hypothetical protein
MKEMICLNCGTIGKPKSITKGSICIEIILWLLFIIPGLIYSIWRLTTRTKGCPLCSGKMIPLDSPRGKILKKDLENK